MYLLDGRKAIRIELLGQPYHRRPQPPMNVSYFTADPTTDQDIGRFPNGSRAQEDIVALGMRPPTTANRPAMASARLAADPRPDSRTTPWVFTKARACLGVIPESPLVIAARTRVLGRKPREKPLPHGRGSDRWMYLSYTLS